MVLGRQLSHERAERPAKQRWFFELGVALGDPCQCMHNIFCRAVGCDELRGVARGLAVATQINCICSVSVSRQAVHQRALGPVFDLQIEVRAPAPGATVDQQNGALGFGGNLGPNREGVTVVGSELVCHSNNLRCHRCGLLGSPEVGSLRRVWLDQRGGRGRGCRRGRGPAPDK